MTVEPHHAFLGELAEPLERVFENMRIGPVAASSAPELAARVVGLGFGQPQRVRD